TDRLEPDAVLVRERRRQQRSGFDRKAHAWLVLEHALLQDAFQEQPRIGELEIGAALDTELADRLPVLREAIVEDQARRRDRVLPASPFEVEIPSSISTSLGSATAASVETNGRY